MTDQNKTPYNVAPLQRDENVRFSRPVRQVVMMLLVVVLVMSGAWAIHGKVADVFLSNLWLNGLIAFVFLIGVLTCFWQVAAVLQSTRWIEGFVNSVADHETRRIPLLLVPLATLLRARGARRQIAESSTRSILESVASRLDEARDITRYLTNLLVFLGLLGTFYGLATTVPAVVETIRSLGGAGEDGLPVFDRLIKGLEAQLGGMGTAFSSSLLGLAGSLVVGLLELFSGHGQSRFYQELEEWLSSITQLGFSGSGGDGADGLAMVPVVIERMEDQVRVITAQAVAERQRADAQLADLGHMVADLSQRADAQLADLGHMVADLSQRLEASVGVMASQTTHHSEMLVRLSEGQERLAAALGQAEDGARADAEARMRLRSIDVQLLRILEEISAGRQESMAELRTDIGGLTAALIERVASEGVVPAAENSPSSAGPTASPGGSGRAGA